MSHEIEQHQDQAFFASANVQAWHRLGTVLDLNGGGMTAEQAMAEAHLGGWDLRKENMTTASGLVVPGRSAVVRTNPVTGQDEVLGDVGQNYHVIQNEEHAEFLNILVDESGAHFETAGSLYGGSQVFLTMKMPGHMAIGGRGGDQVDTYIAAVNSHDGSSSFTLMATPVRVVCANTVRIGIGQAKSIFRIRHTSGAEKALRSEAREKLDLTFQYLDVFQDEANRLVQATMTQVQFEEIIAKEFGAKEDAAPATKTRADARMDDLISLFTEARTQKPIADTAWAGFNALTEWYDHQSPARGENADTNRAMNAVLYSEAWKTKAFRLMSDFVSA